MYIASYFKERIFSKSFETLEQLLKYNEDNNIKNHNLHFECTLDDILKGGIIVCLEGDDNLEDDELSEALDVYGDKYLLLNNIYENPNQLVQLRDKNIDILIIQSTGLRQTQIEKMQEQYIKHIGNYPKNIVCILGDEDGFLYPLIEAAPFKIEVFKYQDVDNGKIILSKWLGTKFQEENK